MLPTSIPLFSFVNHSILPSSIRVSINVASSLSISLLTLQATLAILMIIPSDIGILTNIFSFTAWIFYGMVAASVLIMRVTHKDLPRPYKVRCSAMYNYPIPPGGQTRWVLIQSCNTYAWQNMLA